MSMCHTFGPARTGQTDTSGDPAPTAALIQDSRGGAAMWPAHPGPSRPEPETVRVPASRRRGSRPGVSEAAAASWSEGVEAGEWRLERRVGQAYGSAARHGLRRGVSADGLEGSSG